MTAPEPTPDGREDAAEAGAAAERRPADAPSPGPAPSQWTGPLPSLLHYASGTDEQGEWTTVWTARDYVEANLAVGRLLELGMHARVDMENAATIGAWAGTGPAGTSVQVTRTDAAAARKLLEEIDARRARRQGLAYLPCPSCGHAPAAGELHPARKAGIALLFLAPLAGFALSFVGLDLGYRMLVAVGLVVTALWLLVSDVTPRWTCTKCGHRWEQAEPGETEADEDDDLSFDDSSR